MLKELTITIMGRPASKKNSRVFRKGAKGGYTVPGDNFKKFESYAIEQLINLIKKEEKFGGMPVYMEYEFYKPGMDLQDVDNAICSINDVLQHDHLKIIDDDKQILSGKFDVYPGSGEWKTIVRIRQLFCNWGEHEQDPISQKCMKCGMTEAMILFLARKEKKNV